MDIYTPGTLPVLCGDTARSRNRSPCGSDCPCKWQTTPGGAGGTTRPSQDPSGAHPGGHSGARRPYLSSWARGAPLHPAAVSACGADAAGLLHPSKRGPASSTHTSPAEHTSYGPAWGPVTVSFFRSVSLSLSLSRPLCFLSSAPQLCSLTGAGDWFVISNKELPTKDNGVKRTSLPLSVAQSTLPFRMMKSELLTPLFQSLSAFAIWSPLNSNACVSQSLLWHVLLLLQCAFRLLPSPVECDER